MNILLVNHEHEFVTIEFFNATFLQMLLFCFLIRDIMGWMIYYKYPNPILFRHQRNSNFYSFLSISNQKIRKIIMKECDLIHSKNDFWKFYYIDVSFQNISIKSFKLKFFKWLISKFFKISLFNSLRIYSKLL